MDTELTSEKQLLSEIERLREQYPQTQDLYREVCVLLFFRHGMTPTTNKLYQLVRKGSMTAPAEALNRFWEDLREKSRIRIEHPDLPESLKTAAGEMTASLWTAAQSAAQESFAVFRSEAQAAIMAAQVATDAASMERDQAKLAMERTQHSLEQALQRVSTLEQQCAAAAATNVSLEQQLKESKEGQIAQQQQLESARKDFSAELDKLRTAAQIAEERFKASETRALLEIDRERTVAAKLQKELDLARQAGIQSVERMRTENGELQVQLGSLRQELGTVVGSLQVVTAQKDAAVGELKSMQDRLSDAIARESVVQAEAKRWRTELEDARHQIADLRESAVKPVRLARKPKAGNTG